jgi:hypothetical protein
MATDVPTQSDPELDPETEVDFSESARRMRAEQGPFEILKLPDDGNPGLPPEVWEHPPAGYGPPQ